MKGMTKNILIGVGVVILIIVGVVVYNRVGGSNSSSDSGLVSSSTGSSPVQSLSQNGTAGMFSNELVALLNSLQNIALNDSVLFNDALSELRDITIPLSREGNPGRRNPFAPVGAGVVPTSQTQQDVQADEVATFDSGISTLDSGDEEESEVDVSASSISTS
jgi:hypothetical protein